MERENFTYAIEKNLKSLEIKRLEIISKVKMNCLKFILIPMLIIAGILFVLKNNLFFFEKRYIAIFYTFIIVVIIISILLIVHFYNKGKNKFKNIYKEILIEPLMSKIFPELNYQKNAYVSENNFNTSKLFTSDYSLYNGDDYFSGEIENTKIEFSELNVVKSKSATSGEVQNSRSSSKIFSGLFLHAKLLALRCEKTNPYKFLIFC